MNTHWLELDQVLSHVHSCIGNKEAAEEQLQLHLLDGEIKAQCRWKETVWTDSDESRIANMRQSHEPEEVPRSFWHYKGGGKIIFRWQDNAVIRLFGPKNYWLRVGVTLSTNDVYRIWPKAAPTSERAGEPKKRKKPGPVPTYDWDAFRDAFFAKVHSKTPPDWPDTLNVEGWQTQADVERWVQELAVRGGGKEPSVSSIREHVSEWLSKRPE